MSPMDRGERSGLDEIQTMSTIPEIVAIQRQVAAETHCAFFDTYDAMGGDGTMARWYAASPRLVTADLLHPTPQGATIVAGLFVEQLGLGYNRWKMQHGIALPSAAPVITAKKQSLARPMRRTMAPKRCRQSRRPANRRKHHDPAPSIADSYRSGRRRRSVLAPAIALIPSDCLPRPFRFPHTKSTTPQLQITQEAESRLCGPRPRARALDLEAGPVSTLTPVLGSTRRAGPHSSSESATISKRRRRRPSPTPPR